MKIQPINICFFCGMIVLGSILESAAQDNDSTKTINLKPFEITETERIPDMLRLPETQGCIIYTGKKNEVIHMASLQADLSSNNARQVFAKVPGVSVWENDGSGIQMGIATRGLSPNRSWEFNVRQNSYDISAEPFGYPESYFSPPLEALQSIELVRGSASLQYGPQFGGLLNYVLKKPSNSKVLEVESYQTKGSYGMTNSFNSIGGTYKKLTYFGYYHHRNAAGWRENSRYHTNTAFASLEYQLTQKQKISAEYTRMNYVSQQAGGLTDSMFSLDAQNSIRHRNWFGAPWNVAAIKYSLQANTQTRIEAQVFGTLAQRNSVGFTKSINQPDSIITALKNYAARQVDRDYYKNIGMEVRGLYRYTIRNQQSSLSVGMRMYTGHTLRRQVGIGSSSSDYDLTITKATNGKSWGRELDFTTNNVAVFAENMFKLSSKFTLTPGIRSEWIQATAVGYITPTAAGELANSERNRHILLAGLGSEYRVNTATNLYGNISQSYRPVTFSELTPSATTDVIDPNLKDAKGYNVDLGYRGRIKSYLTFDVSAFYLLYDNRIGTVVRNGSNYRTNMGTSVSKGVETFMEVDLQRLFCATPRLWSLKVSSSYAFVDARYTKWNNPAIAFDPKKSIENKRVEYAPQHIARIGITYRFRNISGNVQWNYVSDVYTDAANTEAPNAAATIGKIPAYSLMDINLSYEYQHKYFFKAGSSNVLDARYATRRSGGYPGPGLLPGNGRTFFVSVGTRL